jgi:hypothetical protein
MTEQELFETLDPQHHDIVRGWLERGDGVAVYASADFGPDYGHRQFVSFGSVRAQIEDNEPPTRLPDIGGSINWRYQLEATIRRRTK